MAENDKMTIDYKLSKAKICKNRVCFATTFFLARNISHQVILGNPFTLLLYPFNVDIDGITCTRIPNHPVHFEFLTKPKQHELNLLQHLSTQVSVMETEVKQINCLSLEKTLQQLPRQVNIIERKTRQINYLNQEITRKRIEEQLQTPEIQGKIKAIEEKIKKELCSLNPTAFQHRKLHEISLPYEDGFKEKDIPTKAKPIHMNKEYLEYCKKEIQEYLDKGLIRPSKSLWSCTGFM